MSERQRAVEPDVLDQLAARPGIRLERRDASLGADAERRGKRPEADVGPDVHDAAAFRHEAERAVDQVGLVDAEEHQPMAVVAQVERVADPLAFHGELDGSATRLPQHAEGDELTAGQSGSHGGARQAPLERPAAADSKRLTQPVVHQLAIIAVR